MSDENSKPQVVCAKQGESTEKTKSSSRRAFLGQAGAAAALLAGAGPLASPTTAKQGQRNSPDGDFSSSNPTQNRAVKAMQLRVSEATRDLTVHAVNVNNGDDALYADKAGTFTKGLAHDAYGRVTPASYASFKKALASGLHPDFENVIMGGIRTLNGPQGGLMYDLEAVDGTQFGQPQVPPAPTLASDQSGTELLEHYWGALLRDVAFTDYDSNGIAAAAAAELSSQASYVGPRNGSGQVTTDLLFRGIFPGATLGPYLSQLFVQPTSFGAQPLSQQMNSFLATIDFGTNFSEWLNIQNGVPTGLQTTNDPTLRYRRNGRDLAAYTRVDVLYQAYFTAFLVLAGIGAPLNPGNPYLHSTTENGFGSFGGPDFAGVFGEIATKALNAVWWQKWFVHLRPRPEAAGGIVQLLKTGQGQFTDATLSNTILKSTGLQQSFDKYGSWLLSLAFPEGSPMHPAYPTGHGTVGGACITVLKFIFDGSFVIPNPVVPTSDGLSLETYTGADAGQLTVNGELNKLGHNVTFGHGIHAGIHWRSDSDTSLLLGEALALNFLQNRAKTYNEPFTIRITKFDGSVATISNE
jgi:hypothetical protein